MKNITAFIEYLIANNKGYRVFNYADNRNISTKELISSIEDSLDVSVPPIRIPYWLGLLGGYSF